MVLPQGCRPVTSSTFKGFSAKQALQWKWNEMEIMQQQTTTEYFLWKRGYYLGLDDSFSRKKMHWGCQQKVVCVECGVQHSCSLSAFRAEVTGVAGSFLRQKDTGYTDCQDSILQYWSDIESIQKFWLLNDPTVSSFTFSNDLKTADDNYASCCQYIKKCWIWINKSHTQIHTADLINMDML